MSDDQVNNRPDEPAAPDPRDLMPVEGLPEEPAGRRAASAQFVVSSAVGSEAALREAMDPANQSLAEALRLSFRVLQVVILVLVVLFLFSGWKSVETGQTGVLTVWGNIAEVGGSKVLTPGLKFSRWPYPAGEFILFQEENRSIDDLQGAFWMATRPGMTFEEAVAQSTVFDRLRPGRDGSLLTGEGDLAHMQVSARYAVQDPLAFVQSLDDSQADRITRLALQRAVVHIGATLSLEEIIEKNEAVAAALEGAAQNLLDRIDSGLALQAVNLPRTSAPLAIRKTMEQLQQTRIQMEEQLELARQAANETLTNIAGARSQRLIDLIDAYEQALDLDDDGLAVDRLERINEQLQDAATTGEVARIINLARSYESHIESTLGADARAFAGILPSYRKHPEMVARRLWLEGYSRVLDREDVEIMYVPDQVSSVNLRIQGLDEVAELRRDRRLNRREAGALADFQHEFRRPFGGRARRAEDITMEGPGRQLRVDEETGEVRSRGQNP